MVKYIEALSLGMERVDYDDPIFEEEYGYAGFYLEKKTQKGNVVWFPQTRTAMLLAPKKRKVEFHTFEQLKVILHD